MRIELPRPGRLGVSITDVEVDALRHEDVEEIRSLVYTHQLAVFHGLSLDDPGLIALAGRFGRPEPYFQQHYHHPEHPEIFVSSNVPLNGRKVGVAGTGQFWHTDYQFFDEPLSITSVMPRVLPRSPRATYFVDMRRVYRELPNNLRTYTEGTRSFHDASNYYKVQPWDIDRAIVDLVREFHEVSPGAWHPTVLTHPVTGERALYVSQGFTMAIDGFSHEESQAALRALFEHSTQERYVHAWPWQLGDLFLWDNRTLIHQASRVAPGEQSCSHRVSVFDGLPFYAEARP